MLGIVIKYAEKDGIFSFCSNFKISFRFIPRFSRFSISVTFCSIFQQNPVLAIYVIFLVNLGLVPCHALDYYRHFLHW